MNRVTALLVGIAALAAIPTIAEAAQGCGRGMYYNGRRCVPQDDIGYRTHHRRYVRTMTSAIGATIVRASACTLRRAYGFISATTLDRDTTMMMMIKPSGRDTLGRWPVVP